MRIMFFYESLRLGGQQTQTFQLVRRLTMRGHDVTWAYLQDGELRSHVAACCRLLQVPVAVGPKDYIVRPWKLVQIVHRLAAYGRAEGTEVIVSGSGLGAFIAGLAARAIGARHYRLVGCSLVEIERTLYRFYRLGFDKLVDGYFGWPAVFEELAHKGVLAHKFIELNHAVDCEMFRPISGVDRDSVRRELGIEPDEIVIGWIGRIAENMQVGNTVRMAAELRHRGFDRFRLLLVGGGPWVDGVRALITALELDGHATLTGWVPMEDVNRYIGAMDIVPLLEPDPHGGSIVREAMAAGCVALSVDGPSGTQRHFMPEGAAVLVPADNFLEAAAEAVLSLAADVEGRRRISAAARGYAETHMSFETQVDTILRTIEGSSVCP